MPCIEAFFRSPAGSLVSENAFDGVANIDTFPSAAAVVWQDRNPE